MKLVTAENCPFCMRCLLALREKGVAFETDEVDLTLKDGFLERLSPYGRVPVLVDGDKQVCESSVINEYLEDTVPDPALLPRDPHERARARFWIDFADTRFMPAYFNLLKSDAGRERDEWRTRLLDHLAFMDTEGLARTTDEMPYWMGADISLADIAIYPFFERFAAVEAYRHVNIPAELTRLSSWLKTMRERPSVQAVSRPRDYYVAYFGEYYAD